MSKVRQIIAVSFGNHNKFWDLIKKMVSRWMHFEEVQRQRIRQQVKRIAEKNVVKKYFENLREQRNKL
jgi:hypothetical protein